MPIKATPSKSSPAFQCFYGGSAASTVGVVWLVMVLVDPPANGSHTPLVIGAILAGLGLPVATVGLFFYQKAVRTERNSELEADGAIPLQEGPASTQLIALSVMIRDQFGIIRSPNSPPLTDITVGSLIIWLTGILNEQGSGDRLPSPIHFEQARAGVLAVIKQPQIALTFNTPLDKLFPRWHRLRLWNSLSKQFPVSLPGPTVGLWETRALVATSVGMAVAALLCVAHFLDRAFPGKTPTRSLFLLLHATGWLILFSVTYASVYALAKAFGRFMIVAPTECRTLGQIAVWIARKGPPANGGWSEVETRLHLIPLIATAFQMAEMDLSDATHLH